MKNEIVCYAQGYTYSKIENLIKSFKKNVDNTKLDNRIIVLHTGLKYDSVEEYDKHDVVFLDVDKLFKSSNVDKKLSPYTLKVIYFYLYCKSISKAENVFLCDATDVFINKNPFELVTDKVSLFVENEIIGKCPVNTEWLKRCYNDDIANLIKKESILNGGLILGKRVQCISLLKEMCDDLSGIIGRIGNYQNPDQAVLNKLVYFDRWNYIISRDNDMINCAHLTNKGFAVKFENNKIKIGNTVPYVVHQYPCFKNLEVKW